MRFITPGAALLCAISLVISGWALFGQFHQQKQRRDANSEAWHSVICYLEQLTMASPQPTAKKQQAIRVYNHILELVEARPCA